MLAKIKGVGPKTIIELNNINIYTVSDLLTYYPYRYNYYKPEKLSEIKENQEGVITGVIETKPNVFYLKKNLNKLTFKLNTGSEIVIVTIFNRAFLKNHLQIGKTITIIGKYNINQNLFTAKDIKLNPILQPEVEPVYHLNNNIKKATFVKIINEELEKNIYLPNYIPEYIEKKYNFIDKISAIKIIHHPTSAEDLKKALLYLIYEELFVFMLKINFLKVKKEELIYLKEKKYNTQLSVDFISDLPFTLTGDQKIAVNEITNDITSSKRMNRLLLGDVGSGKTIVAFISLYINYLAGYQGVLMVPTEILAQQHYNNCLQVFKNYKVKIALLTSSIKSKDRKQIINDIKDHKLDILIGTHSVLNEEVVIPKLGLVITDEQHRFGVKQRQYLQQKGSDVDVLYMSATPIPRTVALTIYGDMDISQIKEKPLNNIEVITKLFKEDDIKEVLLKIVEQIKLGHQIYVVVPLVEENEDNQMENVESIYNKLNTAFNNKISLGIIHGKLSALKKEKIMNDFKENKTKILISTTVIEVGVDVSNATMMIIFNAERFGLATLHQLRGRVGRSSLQSYCYMISDFDIERLKIMEETTDGFEISEKDFKLRGTGDVFGIRQSGDMNFKLANIKTDYKILMQCKKDSEEFLLKLLQNPELYPHQKSLLDSIMFID
ncbi:MAG: ATP-dependent DNA helicase RecG [Bacilli bacterium]|nr:ATP-dependent DNA helicase RecG [Bacilli bacterium]